MENIAENLRLIRQEKGFSQQYVADCLNISVSTISRMENNPGKINLEYFYLVADFYEIKLSKIFSDTESEIEKDLSKIKVQLVLPFSMNSKHLFQIAKALRDIELQKEIQKGNNQCK